MTSAQSSSGRSRIITSCIFVVVGLVTLMASRAHSQSGTNEVSFRQEIPLTVNISTDESITQTFTLIIQTSLNLSGAISLSSRVSIAATGESPVSLTAGPPVAFVDGETENPQVLAEASDGPGFEGVVNGPANLRIGPGRNFARSAGLEEGTVVTIVGMDDQKEWYLLESGRWIHSSLIDILDQPGSVDTSESSTTSVASQNTTVTPDDGSPQYHSVTPQCYVEVPRLNGRLEPQYVGLKGYIKGDPRDASESLPLAPWSADVLEQTGPDLWEPSGKKIEAKTPVLVLEQYLQPARFASQVYEGRLVVLSLVDSQKYVIDHYRFTPSDYWRCSPHVAVEYGPFIAVVEDDVMPIDDEGRWSEMGTERRVFCNSKPRIGEDDNVENGVVCNVYKQYRYGYGGIGHIFPSEGLEIVY